MNPSAFRTDAPPRSPGLTDAMASKLLIATAAGISLVASVYLFFSGPRE